MTAILLAMTSPIVVASLNQTDHLVYGQETSATQAFVVEVVSEGDRKIKGQVTPGSTVTVLNERTGDKLTADADSDGDWVIELPDEITLAVDDLLAFTVTLPDNSIETRDVKVASAEGKAFVVEYVSSSNRQIKGQVTPGSTVTVLIERTGDKQVTDADDSGNWVIDLPAEISLQADDLLAFTVTLPDGSIETRDVKVDSFAETTETTVAETTLETTSIVENSRQPILISDYITYISDAKGQHMIQVDSVTADTQIIKGQAFKSGLVIAGIEGLDHKFVLESDKDGKFELDFTELVQEAGLTETVTFSPGQTIKLVALSEDLQSLDYVEVIVP